jgi:hypothetical protein
VQETAGKKILRVLVPRGDDAPYAVDDNKIYIRSESETGLAVRDEIVGLVLRSQGAQPVLVEQPVPLVDAGRSSLLPDVPEVQQVSALEDDDAYAPPRTGVEVVSVEERNGARYYTMRDLRNGNVVKNVTRSSARRLWHYAITEHARLPGDISQAKIQWQGNLGLLHQQKQGKFIRYDLVQRTPQGIRYYFGVTEDGIHSSWKSLVGQEDD